MSGLDLCDCWGKLGCTLHTTCRRALEEPDPFMQYFVAPDFWNGECSRYAPVELLADKRREQYETAVERFKESL